MSSPNSDSKTSEDNLNINNKSKKKGAIVKALLIGFSVGIMFILAAKMVNIALF